MEVYRRIFAEGRVEDNQQIVREAMGSCGNYSTANRLIEM
jgi:hypothetical protein